MTEFKPATELLTEDMLKMRFNKMVENASDALEFQVKIMFDENKDMHRFVKSHKSDLERLGYKINQVSWVVNSSLIVSW